MMKSNRDNFIFYLTQIVPVIVALVISIIIYRYWSDNNKACLALTWAAIIFLFLCFYNIIFKNKRNGMIIPILSGLSILLFANKFYDYDTLKTLLPILKNIDSYASFFVYSRYFLAKKFQKNATAVETTLLKI